MAILVGSRLPKSDLLIVQKLNVMKLTKFEVDKLSTAEANAIKAGSGWSYTGTNSCYGASSDTVDDSGETCR